MPVMNRKLISSPGVLSLLCFIFLAPSCDDQVLLPETGYNWPEKERSYWPTSGWIAAPMEEHQVDPEKMIKGDQFAGANPLARALLVVKDGYLVFEKYYGDGDTARCSNLWSVTKSFSSALVGILIDQDYVVSTHQLMASLMPDYPQFDEITLHHVLTMSTGLNWEEEGKPWVDWVFSDDWVAEALSRGSFSEPGKTFKYSSGNSHFLTALVHCRTGMSTGSFARQYLFNPLGIDFEELEEQITYTRWEDYLEPLDHTWRKDPQGIETASFGLYLTARDMAKFGFLYLNKGKWENRALISES
jgi:CubicO group peptidase (beta-lactamase class C family)